MKPIPIRPYIDESRQNVCMFSIVQKRECRWVHHCVPETLAMFDFSFVLFWCVLLKQFYYNNKLTRHPQAPLDNVRDRQARSRPIHSRRATTESCSRSTLSLRRRWRPKPHMTKLGTSHASLNAELYRLPGITRTCILSLSTGYEREKNK